MNRRAFFRIAASTTGGVSSALVLTTIAQAHNDQGHGASADQPVAKSLMDLVRKGIAFGKVGALRTTNTFTVTSLNLADATPQIRVVTSPITGWPDFDFRSFKKGALDLVSNELVVVEGEMDKDVFTATRVVMPLVPFKAKGSKRAKIEFFHLGQLLQISSLARRLTGHGESGHLFSDKAIESLTATDHIEGYFVENPITLTKHVVAFGVNSGG